GTLMPASPMPEDDIRKVVAYLRSLRAPASQAAAPGDPARGETIFRAQRCVECHMVRGSGGIVGPDLSNIGAERSLNALREALTKPRPNNMRGYRAARILTAEGTTLSGVVKNENNASVQFLETNGGLHLFTRDELREITYPEHSLMPGDYGKRLDPTQMQNLLVFLSRLVRDKEPQ